MKSIISIIKEFKKKNKREIILISIVILISVFSFTVGYITANYYQKKETQIKILNLNE